MLLCEFGESGEEIPLSKRNSLRSTSMLLVRFALFVVASVYGAATVYRARVRVLAVGGRSFLNCATRQPPTPLQVPR